MQVYWMYNLIRIQYSPSVLEHVIEGMGRRTVFNWAYIAVNYKAVKLLYHAT